MNYVKILKELYLPISVLKERYPKAAKKRRIIKKWEKRFGPDYDFKNLSSQRNPFLDFIRKDEFLGVYEPVTYKIFKDENE